MSRLFTKLVAVLFWAVIGGIVAYLTRHLLEQWVKAIKTKMHPHKRMHLKKTAPKEG